MKSIVDIDDERYKASISLCEVDLPGQKRLMEATVAVVGAGALASSALLYLAAAGVGRLRVIDGDTVSLTNLQRQVVHSTPDIGRRKPLSAADRLHSLNPDVIVEPRCEMLTEANAAALLGDADVVLDCTDNYPSRVLISDTCMAMSKPLCYAAISRFQAQLTTFMPGSDGLRGIFVQPPTPEDLECRSCAATGVFNALAGVAGSLQAAEAMKIILNVGDTLSGRLLVIDSLTMNFQTINI